MVRVDSQEQLVALRDRLRDGIQERRRTRTRILVGMGTCGIAAGAREVVDAIRLEVARQGIDAEIVSVGCIGNCEREPLVDIEQPGLSRVTYQNIYPGMVPRLIEEHLIQNRVILDWAVGRLHPDGMNPMAAAAEKEGAPR